MKVSLPLTVAVTALWFTGCPSKTLTLEDGDRLMALALGADLGDVRFINHALIAQVEDGVGRITSSEKGLVALTSTDLILVKGSPNSITEEETLIIPVSHIEGVALEKPFFQFVYQGYRFVILPYRWYTDTVDIPKLNELFDLVVAQSVPEITGTEIFWHHRYIYDAEGANSYFVGSYSQGERVSFNDDGQWSDSSFYHADGSVQDSPSNRPLN